MVTTHSSAAPRVRGRMARIDSPDPLDLMGSAGSDEPLGSDEIRRAGSKVLLAWFAGEYKRPPRPIAGMQPLGRTYHLHARRPTLLGSGFGGGAVVRRAHPHHAVGALERPAATPVVLGHRRRRRP